MITLDLRHAIGRAVADARFGAGMSAAGTSGQGNRCAPDPGLRAGGDPGQYASSVAFGLAEAVNSPAERIAAQLARGLEDAEPWIAKAEETGRGHITITVTPEALEGVAGRVIAAGSGCVRSDALAGCAFPRPAGAGALAAAWETAGAQGAASTSETAGAWETAPTWEEARERLAAWLTTRLAEAAGATTGATISYAQRTHDQAPDDSGEARDAAWEAREGRQQRHQGGRGSGGGGVGIIRSGEKEFELVEAVAFAGRDAVRFSLARLAPGQPADLDAGKIARHHLDNPAYAVRYAHARAASGVRWAAAAADPDLAGPQRPPADPEALALLDALSWLPERVATAARRGRPDEFARYLEHLATAALAALTGPSAALTGPRAVRTRPRGAAGDGPGKDNDTITLARAARTGLAAGLTLLGVSAPDRLLHSVIDTRSATHTHRRH